MIYDGKVSGKRDMGETSVDLRKHSIKNTRGRSRKKDKDLPEDMYEDVWLMTVDEAKELSPTIPLGIQRESKLSLFFLVTQQ